MNPHKKALEGGMHNRKGFSIAARIVRQDFSEIAQRAHTAALNGRLTDRHLDLYMANLKRWMAYEELAAEQGWPDPLYQPMPPIDNRVGRT